MSKNKRDLLPFEKAQLSAITFCRNFATTMALQTIIEEMDEMEKLKSSSSAEEAAAAEMAWNQLDYQLELLLKSGSDENGNRTGL